MRSSLNGVAKKLQRRQHAIRAQGVQYESASLSRASATPNNEDSSTGRVRQYFRTLFTRRRDLSKALDVVNEETTYQDSGHPFNENDTRNNNIRKAVSSDSDVIIATKERVFHNSVQSDDVLVTSETILRANVVSSRKNLSHSSRYQDVPSASTFGDVTVRRIDRSNYAGGGVVKRQLPTIPNNVDATIQQPTEIEAFKVSLLLSSFQAMKSLSNDVALADRDVRQPCIDSPIESSGVSITALAKLDGLQVVDPVDSEQLFDTHL